VNSKVTFKVTQGNGSILQATCDFLLVFYCIYVFIMYRFLDTITYFPKSKEVTWSWTHLL